MEHQTGKYYELNLDLDGRKSMLVFFGFLAICGCFFVVGYIMGHGTEQPLYANTSTAENFTGNDNSISEAYNRINETVKEPVRSPSTLVEPKFVQPEIVNPSVAAVSTNIPPSPSEPVVSGAVTSAASIPPVAVDKPEPRPEETSPSVKQAISGKDVYSVQVAAFRTLRDTGITTKRLEDRGFEYRIELPQTADDYYRLRIGIFATRAEANEMADRLKENGFETMIAIIKGN